MSRHTVPAAVSSALYALLLAACGSDTGASADPLPDASAPQPDAAGPAQTPDAAAQAEAPDAASPVETPDAAVVPPSDALGRCDYTNTFSRAPECKAYTGAGWTVDTATTNCAAPVPGATGAFVPGGICGFDAELGRCEVGDPAGEGYLLVMSGDDASKCALARVACETFASGTFTGSATCPDPTDGPEPPPPVVGGAFIPPYQDCRAPLPGEAPGTGPDGKVCTWTAISGCTEPGRRFEDYASCDVVRTQRPAYPMAPRTTSHADDPRLQDAAFMSELAWVTQQVEASACVCCHTTRASKIGASDWNIEAGPIWTDTVSDLGLAILAGYADSTAFGAFPPDQNHGFSRDQTGVPTTDVARMKAFLGAEWARRGKTDADIAGLPAFGGPLVAQAEYEPRACARGEGVDAARTVTWTGGGARYVYVLDAGSDNPGVPPNLDLPLGTRWRLDVPPDGQPVASGVTYGQAPAGTTQKFPVSGAPEALVPGQPYLIYVLLDVGVPVTRCLFTAQ